MKLELFRDGNLYMSIEAVGDDVEFAILPKSIVNESELSPKSFKELYFKCIRESNTTYVDAYEKAEQIHEQYFSKRKYSSWDSFRNSNK